MKALRRQQSLVAVVAVLALMFLPLQLRAQNDIENAFKAEFQGKIVALRGFYSDSNMRFDASGNPLSTLHPGYWSSDGLIQISSVKIKNQRLVLGGKRVISLFNSTACKFNTSVTKFAVKIEIELGPSSQDFAAAGALVHKAVLADAQELSAIVPQYWQVWLSPTECVKDTNGNCKCRTAEEAKLMSASGKAPCENTGQSATTRAGHEQAPESTGVRPCYTKADGTAVFMVGPGVKPPKALHDPDPGYVDIARKAHVQGTTILQLVINERGEPGDISIVRPQGAGLDDKVIEAVKTWRFAPATREDKPVAVVVNVEVNLHLFP
jgi:TonB family protein